MSVTITDDTIEKIYDWIKECCIKNRMEHLASEISVKFNNRLIKTWGRAWCSSNSIELSTLLWLAGSETDKRDTVIHETCHIIVHHKYGSDLDSHGKEWELCMIMSGLDPKLAYPINIKV